MESLNKFSLVAPCGMNCGICMAYLREKNVPVAEERTHIKQSPVFDVKSRTAQFFKKAEQGFVLNAEIFPATELNIWIKDIGQNTI